jgi:hypothetical protein
LKPLTKSGAGLELKGQSSPLPIIVLAGHYDTNLPLKNTAFVGANDGPRNRIQIRIEGD